jgi:tripartite-type tricarboxylate transporter receptor subunit TctC
MTVLEMFRSLQSAVGRVARPWCCGGARTEIEMPRAGFYGTVAVVLIGLTMWAQGYPTRSITMIVPFPAGGPSDVVARIVGEGMGRHLGHTIVIENVGGAGGTIGTTRAAMAQADGYTILGAGMGSHVAAPALYANLKYDSTRNFEPIGLTSHAPVAIVARKDFPAADLREFIAHVRQHGGNVKQAHGGTGAASHMACLMFNAQLGLKPTSVAYRGTGPAMNDLIGGHVDFYCDQVVAVAQAVQSGVIKAYAVSSDAPVDALPQVPAAHSAGAPDYRMSIWSAIFAPKGTPKLSVDRLASALDEALADPDVARRLATLGGTVPPMNERGPAYLATLLKAEIARWDPILKAANADLAAK